MQHVPSSNRCSIGHVPGVRMAGRTAAARSQVAIAAAGARPSGVAVAGAQAGGGRQMSTTDRPISPCPTGLDVENAAYREAVRAALANAPPVTPDVHAR